MDDKVIEKLKKLGENIFKIRESKNLTLAELSARTEIKESFLKRIENGTAKRISVSHIYDISDGLGVPPAEICRGL